MPVQHAQRLSSVGTGKAPSKHHKHSLLHAVWRLHARVTRGREGGRGSGGPADSDDKRLLIFAYSVGQPCDLARVIPGSLTILTGLYGGGRQQSDWFSTSSPGQAGVRMRLLPVVAPAFHHVHARQQLRTPLEYLPGFVSAAAGVSAPLI